MSGFILVAMLLLLIFKLSNCDVTLRILHTNRLRSNFEAMGKGNRTRGGIARIIEYVNTQKSHNKATLYFDTMDWFAGTIWYNVHKMRICADFMKILQVDVLGLGEGEMYEGLPRNRETNFWEYINAICNKTILCTNCYYTASFEGSLCIDTSKVIELENTKVGIIAYIQRELVPTKFFKMIQFTKESKAVNMEAKRLMREGVNITIVIGHGQFHFNEELIKTLENVDLIIGGHPRQLLHNGVPPRGKSVGPYPLRMKDANGEEVLLVYAGQHGLYVGNMALTFDHYGKVIHFDGNTKYMGENIPENPTALKILESYRPEVERYKKQIIGQSRVYLDAACRTSECNLGNLLTDALIHHRANQWAESKRKYWTDAAIAFVNAGNIKSPIAVENKSVVLAELITSLPYNNAVFTITLNGSILKRVFEHSGALIEEEADRFLQVAGLHVIYDLNRNPNERVISLKARCAKCETPFYEDVRDDRIYKAVTTEFLVDGGDGYEFGDAKSQKLGDISETDIFRNYIEFYKTIQTGREERIIVLNRYKSSKCAKKILSGNLELLMCILYFYKIFGQVFSMSGISLPFETRSSH